jgi:hypothetical protein
MEESMSKKDEVKQLKELTERFLGQPADNLFFKQRTSVRTSNTEAYIQELEPVIDGVRTRCLDANVIDLSGRASTDEGGKRTWKLRDYIVPCDRGFDEFDRPMSFVATPHSNSPIYLTTRPAEGFLTPSPPDDVVVEVFTWDAGGNPAPNVTFSWRCRVPYYRQIIID